MPTHCGHAHGMLLTDEHLDRAAFEEDENTGPVTRAAVWPPHTLQAEAEGGRAKEGTTLVLVGSLHQKVSGCEANVHLSEFGCDTKITEGWVVYTFRGVSVSVNKTNNHLPY